ncbi:MAG: DUF5711 family protein [Eubacteriales bacterium]|nr:DUF5711 family protein [Eubacteriales bacterium]
MESYKRNLRRHRLRNLGITAGLAAAAVLCVLGIRFSLENRTFQTYEVVRSFDRSDTVTTQYTEFLDYAVKYSKDGVSCVDEENRLVWSQTYNLQNPIVEVCQGSMAVADKDGSEVMIFDRTGLQGQIQTLLPIRQISLSGQGVLAVLLEDGDICRVNLYSKDGTQLVESKFELQETGFPVRISLSADATKLAVSFLQVQDGAISSCLAFYNFDSVGENYEDHLVASRIIQGTVVPGVHYLDDTHCVFVGAGELLFYEGSQIPEQGTEVALEREVCSIFYSDNYVGLVLEGEEQEYALQVYTAQGRLQFETEFDQSYDALKFSGSNILIYNDFDCTILNHSGTIIFTGTFDESISNLYTLSGNNRYMVMHGARTDQIRLK